MYVKEIFPARGVPDTRRETQRDVASSWASYTLVVGVASDTCLVNINVISLLHGIINKLESYFIYTFPEDVLRHVRYLKT